MYRVECLWASNKHRKIAGLGHKVCHFTLCFKKVQKRMGTRGKTKAGPLGKAPFLCTQTCG